MKSLLNFNLWIMKSKFIFMTILLISYVVYPQENYQQTKLELDKQMNSQESYNCMATTSIRLLPGFAYRPVNDKNMTLKIDRYSVFPPMEGYCDGTYSSDNGVVGTLKSEFEVSNTGAAVYSIKIEMPDAIAGLTPNLSITYNSQSSNGIMGWGWNLSGLSEIIRVGQTQYHDGNITSVDFANDRFMMDGQRLMLASDSEYGANETEYKTEIDNMDKIISYGNNKSPQCFIVYKSDGQIWEYGSTNDSRVETQTDTEVVLKWLLSKISDRNGNSILFNYDKDVGLGETYIDNIQYVSNEKANVLPAYTVRFVYKTKESDFTFYYINGDKVSDSKLLKNIKIINNYTANTLFDYSFDYHKPGLYGNDYFIHYRLNSVGLTVGDEKINPTKIIWNAKKNHYPTVDNHNFPVYQLDKSVFSNVPFVGDFNGDGLSDVLIVPYKIQDTYPSDVDCKVYINNGDGGFHASPIAILRMSKFLEWIYLYDINDDGKDDIISYELESEDSDKVAVTFYIEKNGSFVKDEKHIFGRNVILLPGKFLENDDKGIIFIEVCNENVGYRRIHYMRYVNGTLTRSEIASGGINNRIANYQTMDVSGDGINEIMVMYDDGYKIYNMKANNGFSFALFLQGNSVTKDAYPFPNDFNGDGKTDLLYYDPRNHWNMLFSKGNGFTQPLFCSNNYLFHNIVLSPQDRYRCSLQEMQKPSITIRTGDFDGDGCADVGVFKSMAGNYYVEMGFKPYIKPDEKCGFEREYRYYMPLNYSHQNIHIGRFLPQENISILSNLPRQPYNSQKAYIASLYPHSAYYSVERIVDGMNNMRGFSYDYLMRNDNAQDDFYTCSSDIIHGNVRRTSIPIPALKSDTVMNINNKPMITKYKYHNAMTHTKGRGVLGFERIIKDFFIGNNHIQRYETYNKYEDSYCFLLPEYVKVYYGDKQLLRKNTMHFDIYNCIGNNKIVMPLMVLGKEVIYDPDNNKPHKVIVTKNEYESDASGKAYQYVVNLDKKIIGYDKNENNDNPIVCCYYNEIVTTHDNDLEQWIINRPKTIKTSYCDMKKNRIGNVKSFTYDNENPLRVVKETELPNTHGDNSDPLQMSIEYEYDRLGNVIQRTQSSPSLGQSKTVRFEYSDAYQYRYLTKTIDESGKEIVCEYDNDYGYLTSTLDYNDFVTISSKSPIGVDDIVVMPDGIVTSKVLRWASGHDYAPAGSAYYQWEKSTGNAETIVFYHKSGAVLRSVSFDVKGKAIFVDKNYDDYGNLKQESMPYYQDDEKLYVTYVYDKYNRLVETLYPNGMIKQNKYDGDLRTISMTGSDGKIQSKKDTYNVMDWIVSSEDDEENVISYDYNSVGLIESVQLGDDPKSRIIITYDNCGNRKTMSDPNYGLVSYEYDAMGNLKRFVNQKGGEMIFKYDAMGRLVERVEEDPIQQTSRRIQWIYSVTKGEDGLLEKIVADNQQINYEYDDELKLIKTTEIVNGGEYSTSYKYDDANRVEIIDYSTGVSLRKVYSNSGYEKEIYDATDNKLLWRTSITEPSGMITEYQLGNGIKTQMSYNSSMLIENITTTNEHTKFQDMNYEYDGFGNMIYRSDLTRSMLYEEFEYDELNRLVGISLNGKETGKMIYDNLGNIIEKTVDDVKVLYDAVYDNDRVNAIIKVKSDDTCRLLKHRRKLEYSSFEDVVKIADDQNSLMIEYGYDHNRILMKENIGKDVISKIYVGDCEYIEKNEQKESITYINGPNGVFAICVIDSKGNKSYNYVHRDNLGSWCVVTDEDCNVLQEYSYDAWGNLRNADDWKIFTDKVDLLYDRGFTGHEHLVKFCYINMNGRLYDPQMSMMLSPDNNIQLPQMSQNYNRYSYCLNNPLKYTDPSGEFVESIVLGVIGGAANLVLNADNIDSFGEAALSFGVGFARGFLIEYTMGQSWFLQVGVHATMGGVMSGANQMVAVGDGSFKFSGDDWNSIKTSAYYGLGSGLVTGIMHSYLTEPTANQYGVNFIESCRYKEFGHAMTSMIAHGVGCWFSGQPMLSTLGLKDIGLDLRMLGLVANRFFSSYVYESGFAEEAVQQRGLDIKNSMLKDILLENPDHPDFSYKYEVVGVFAEDARLYVVGNITALLPGEMIEVYQKPYLHEVVSFPFSFSLFKSLFFNGDE